MKHKAKKETHYMLLAVRQQFLDASYMRPLVGNTH